MLDVDTYLKVRTAVQIEGLSKRADAAVGIARLKALGIRVLMLTGDNRRTGSAIAGVLDLEVQAELLPDAKDARKDNGYTFCGRLGLIV